MAKWMDDAFRIPGTSIRFGFDPLMGLIPGVGDMLAGLIASTILVSAQKARVPKIVQLRMAANIFLNAVLGAIPGFGDLFSIWFRSNRKNYELLEKHQRLDTASKEDTTESWLFVVGLFMGMFTLIVGFFVLIFGLVKLLFS